MGKSSLKQSCRERLSLALTIGSSNDIKYWLGEWTYNCCYSGYEGKIRWLVGEFFAEIERRRQKLPADNYTECESGKVLGFLGQAGKSLREISSLEVVKDIMIPAIARSGNCSSLLAELHECILKA